jgi:hypothetical protein
LPCLRTEKLSGKTVSFYTYEIIMFFSRWHIWTSHAWNRRTRNTKVHNSFSFSCSIYFITECLHRPGNFLVSIAYCVHYLNFTSLVPQGNRASHCDLVHFQSNLIVCFHFSYKNMVFKKKLQAQKIIDYLNKNIFTKYVSDKLSWKVIINNCLFV